MNNVCDFPRSNENRNVTVVFFHLRSKCTRCDMKKPLFKVSGTLSLMFKLILNINVEHL